MRGHFRYREGCGGATAEQMGEVESREREGAAPIRGGRQGRAWRAGASEHGGRVAAAMGRGRRSAWLAGRLVGTGLARLTGRNRWPRVVRALPVGRSRGEEGGKRESRERREKSNLFDLQFLQNLHCNSKKFKYKSCSKFKILQL